jgi:hypothetical protein
MTNIFLAMTNTINSFLVLVFKNCIPNNLRSSKLKNDLKLDPLFCISFKSIRHVGKSPVI